MTARVLVVDDDDAVREMLATILEIEGAEVVARPSASEGVKALGEHAFDLVITDMRMETPTAGFDVVAAAAHSSGAPPVVVLTAFPLRDSELHEYGPAVVLQKGSDPMGMIHQLRRILALARKPAENAAEPGQDRKSG